MDSIENEINSTIDAVVNGAADIFAYTAKVYTAIVFSVIGVVAIAIAAAIIAIF